MAWKEKPIEKLYWTIGEAALIIGVAPSCLRYWLKHFDLDDDVKRSRHTSPYGANRKLTAKEVNQLFEIKRLLQVEGFTIWGAKKKLAGDVSQNAGAAAMLNAIP